jgi:hypothetical protein
VAYVQLGGEEVQATWQQDTATWMVTKISGDAQIATTRSVLARLLFVDHPVVRLHPQALYADAGSSSSSNSSMHRVSLLLEANQTLLFIGSDQSASAPSEQPAGGDDGGPVSVTCVARGCWGTCLPVVVAGMEVQEAQGGEEHEGHTSLAALTVSNVDADELLMKPPWL